MHCWTLLLLYVSYSHSWEHFRAASDYEPIRTLDIPHYQGNITFGRCFLMHKYLFYNVFEPAERLAGGILLRNWLNVTKTPSCLKMSPAITEDLTEEFHLPTFQVMICIARVSYCHTTTRFIYYYYEWFYPMEWVVTSWNLTFFYYNVSEFDSGPFLRTVRSERLSLPINNLKLPKSSAKPTAKFAANTHPFFSLPSDLPANYGSASQPKYYAKRRRTNVSSGIATTSPLPFTAWPLHRPRYSGFANLTSKFYKSAPKLPDKLRKFFGRTPKLAAKPEKFSKELPKFSAKPIKTKLNFSASLVKVFDILSRILNVSKVTPAMLSSTTPPILFTYDNYL